VLVVRSDLLFHPSLPLSFYKLLISRLCIFGGVVCLCDPTENCPLSDLFFLMLCINSLSYLN
jgi:hypothetical protein